MTEKVEVSQALIYEAFYNWAVYTYPDDHRRMHYVNTYIQFQEFMGSHISWYSQVTPMTPEVARKIELLAGPHSYTMLKMLEAQKEASE